MTLVIILLAVFAGVALMVFFGERFGKPMSQEEQAKYGNVTWVLVFILLIAAIIGNML